MLNKNRLLSILILTIPHLWLTEIPKPQDTSIQYFITSSVERAQICPVDDGGLQVSNIGSIQGSGPISPCESRRISIQGIVTGIREDQNQRGARFYTFFIQDPPGQEDGLLETSDGIAGFSGSSLPPVEIGDLVQIEGVVQEYFGLTEIGYHDLVIEVLDRNLPLPSAVILDPPEETGQSLDYFEKLEGMLVGLEDGYVIGPTHQGCGFAAISGNLPEGHIGASSDSSQVGRIINILHYTDVACSDFPQVAVGDRIGGTAGPLTYEFDQFKVVLQKNSSINIHPSTINLSPLPAPSDGQLSIATFNLNDFFSPEIEGVELGESDREKWETKVEKIAATISEVLHCPTVIGLQEVENSHGLEELVGRLQQLCGFSYGPILIEGPDARGIDNAALIDPNSVTLEAVNLHQRCDQTQTEVNDPEIDCPAGQYPLFSRPPLELLLRHDEQEYVIYVNHFKSKRGGEEETAPIRIAQAQQLRSLIEETAANDLFREIIVLGDFNDYEDSRAARELTKGDFLKNVLKALPIDSRYSYNFGGASQLVDWILVSKDLAEKVSAVDIAHVNADYPFGWSDDAGGSKQLLRSSDHDIPFAVFQIEEPPMIIPTTVLIEPTAVVEIVEPTTQLAAAAEISIPTPELTQEVDEEESKEPAASSESYAAITIVIFATLIILLALGIKIGMDQR